MGMGRVINFSGYNLKDTVISTSILDWPIYSKNHQNCNSVDKCLVRIIRQIKNMAEAIKEIEREKVIG